MAISIGEIWTNTIYNPEDVQIYPRVEEIIKTIAEINYDIVNKY